MKGYKAFEKGRNDNMKGYKAFEKGMICRGKQYAENTVFEEEEAVICKKGMHFCKEPLDVLEYYPLVDENGNITEFAEVEALDEVLTDDNKKYCTKKLKVKNKIDFLQLVQAAISENSSINIEKTVSSGSYARIDSSGEFAQIGSSGSYARIGSSGDYAQISSSGDSAQIGSSGCNAQIGSSGSYAQIGSSGKNAVICCVGNGSIVKAKKGSWITLAEWGCSNEENTLIPICVKTAQVDGKKIKEDTFYKLVNGELKEVEE